MTTLNLPPYLLEARDEYHRFLGGRRLSQIEDCELITGIELAEKLEMAMDEYVALSQLLAGTYTHID